ncbi:hypothetical protein C8R45DRAFT_1087453 [Mycena sanguinolenta]|nr:hypothetical protein C8R45DRAFT_1087453 [Mycena sanguinolenta]
MTRTLLAQRANAATYEESASGDTVHASARETAKSRGSTDLGIDVLFAEYLHSRRSSLIECLFGSLVDISSCVGILREFLLMSVLSVQKEVDKEWKDIGEDSEGFNAASTTAAVHANDAVKPCENLPPDPYKWQWGLTAQPPEAPAAAALFFNVVAIAAHAASIRSVNATHHPLPSLRFITLPDTQRTVPLSKVSATAEDCYPEILALDLATFSEAPKADCSSGLHFRLPNCPFEYIRNVFPDVLKFTDKQKAANGSAIRAFEKWFQDQEIKTHLDLSRFCWPQVELTAEAIFTDLAHSISQELVCMRQQRRTQPWMGFILGLVVTTKVFGVLRADALGVEQCTFDKCSSRGVLDSIRICLGVVRSNALQRGQHEAFELSETKTLDHPHLKATSDNNSGADVFSAPGAMVEYHHRTARFIVLRGSRVHYSQDGSRPDTRFYVHHLVQDNGSLVGRCTRIFCVSRERQAADGVRNFEGPYALKLYNADCGSDCFKDDLIQVARDGQVKNVLLPTWEWYYDDTLSARGFPPEILKTFRDAEVALLNVASNRREVFAQSDLKRHLAQSADFDEFAMAFGDVVEAIASLLQKSLLHRDLSIGNILLSKDVSWAPSFLSEATAAAQEILGTVVLFTQRPLEQRTGGLIHDFDMAGRLSPEQVTSDSDSDYEGDEDIDEELEVPVAAGGTHKGFRTGTPPFMAIRLLVEGPPHRPSHDIHSLLFVMLLFYYSYPKFVDISFPSQVPPQNRAWPEDVLRWANRTVAFTHGNLKRGFFQYRSGLRRLLKRTFREDLWTRDSRYLDLFWALYDALWIQSSAGPEWIDRSEVDVEEVHKALVAQYSVKRK